MSYLVLGHAAELPQIRPIVPQGSKIIIAEACAKQGTFPHFLYDVFSNPDHKDLLENPVKNQDQLELLFKKPFKIYNEGDSYPPIEYTLFNYSKNKAQLEDEDAYNVEPSGVFEIPITNSTKMQRIKAPFPKEDLENVFQGAIYPKLDLKQKTQLKDLVKNKVTQETLFKLAPGIYYNFLCRSINEEQELKQLIKLHYPKVDLFSDDTNDPFQIADDWLRRKRTVPKDLRSLIDNVLNRRQKSARPISETDELVNLLSSPTISAKTMQRIRNAQLDARDYHNGYTLIAAAAATGHTNVVKELLLRNADIEIPDYDGSTPLHLACSGPHRAIVELLLQANANPNAKTSDNISPLHIVAGFPEQKILTLLLEKGANTEQPDDEGDTPLHVAASNNHLNTVKQLLKYGALINTQNAVGFTPLMEAISEKNNQIIDYLLKRSDLNLRSKTGTSALGYALKAKMTDLVKTMIKLGAKADFNVIAKYATANKMTDLLDFTNKLQNVTNEDILEDQKNMVKCRLKSREWLTKRCLKPCPNERNKQTLRCIKQFKNKPVK